MKGHFLQSEEWEKFEQAEGKETLRVEGEGFSYLAVIEKTKLGEYLYCPYGPVVGMQKDADLTVCLERALNSLLEVAKRRGVVFVRVEPTTIDENAKRFGNERDLLIDVLKKNGLKESHELNPGHTWVIDLTVSQEDLLRGMEDRKRKQWRGHERKGLKIRKTQDPEEVGALMRLLMKVGERNKFTPQGETHLKKQLAAGFATLYLAEFEGKVVAASLVYDYDGVRYAVHAGADDDYRKLAGGTVLSVQEMIDARAAGGRRFDFWGMTPSEDKNHPWYGFTQYKKTFGGYEVDYLGTWDLPVKKLKYKVYEAMRVINRMMRKL